MLDTTTHVWYTGTIYFSVLSLIRRKRNSLNWARLNETQTQKKNQDEHNAHDWSTSKHKKVKNVKKKLGEPAGGLNFRVNDVKWKLSIKNDEKTRWKKND